jgi:SAM-dependent MidA family methyltransferase
VENEFEPQTENLALKEEITDRIQRSGPISFREFMQSVLYHPSLGYYTSAREKIGRSGDYLTSPEVSPVFGAMLGRQLREMWEALGSPSRFDVVEAGAGTGAMARDIICWSRRSDTALARAMRYTIVEVSGPLLQHQQSRLAAEGLAGSVEWAPRVPDNVSGCILSNELLDAMSVHRVTVRSGRLLEIHVGLDGTQFVEDLRDPNPSVRAYFDELGLLPGEGCYAEVNLDAPAWTESAAQALKRGFVLTMDYGYAAEELYAPWRTGGTLLCFYRHNPSTDPYARIGRQDITSHVDFTTIRRTGERSGLTTLGLVSQSDALLRLGIGEAMQLPEGSFHMEEHFARRRAVMDLIDPGGLGRIKWLLQSSDVSGGDLTCLKEPT